MMRKAKRFFWLALAFTALAFLAYSIPQEAFHEAMSKTNLMWLISGTTVFFISQGLLATRWLLLLRSQQIHISLFQAIKLTYLGLFYNNIMPGAVGGDILRAWYITRHCEEHSHVEAAVSVFVDRLVALLGIILVAVMASFVVGSEIAYAGIQIRWIVWAIFLSAIGVLALLMSKNVRRFVFVS